jgi:hypothetical protein
LPSCAIRLAITLPPELMKAVEAERKDGESTSALIARLLKLALKGEKKC